MADVIHRSKLFGGRETALDVHRRVVWGDKRCTACRQRPVVIEIKTMILVKDLPSDVRAALVLGLAAGDPRMPKPFDTPHGKALTTGQIFACQHHARDAELAAARGPSYAIVTIDRGPGEDKPLVSVV